RGPDPCRGGFRGGSDQRETEAEEDQDRRRGGVRASELGNADATTIGGITTKGTKGVKWI
ncbi:MAG: hypothetical protein AB7J34_01735, partial [Limisphaerales bacterium]